MALRLRFEAGSVSKWVSGGGLLIVASQIVRKFSCHLLGLHPIAESFI